MKNTLKTHEAITIKNGKEIYYAVKMENGNVFVQPKGMSYHVFDNPMKIYRVFSKDIADVISDTFWPPHHVTDNEPKQGRSIVNLPNTFRPRG